MCEKNTHIRCKYYLKNAKSHISVAGFKRIRLKMILEEKDNYLRLYSKHIFWAYTHTHTHTHTHTTHRHTHTQHTDRQTHTLTQTSLWNLNQNEYVSQPLLSFAFSKVHVAYGLSPCQGVPCHLQILPSSTVLSENKEEEEKKKTKYTLLQAANALLWCQNYSQIHIISPPCRELQCMSSITNCPTSLGPSMSLGEKKKKCI